ncbi:MAG: DUF4172 domain-containing protein [Deltaproteobacteria bacterium]|jgi:Fic family protein|nr:DUF4172 domain-containing protein [Deltaproteobacteria bacterium]
MHSIYPTFLWQCDKFLTTPDLPDELLRKVKQNDELEKNLFDMEEVRNTEEVLIKALSEEVIANWAIEGIQLNTAAVRSSIIRHCGMSLPVWNPPGNRDYRDEINAVATTLSFYREPLKKMSADILCDVNARLAPADVRFNNEGKPLVENAPNVWGQIRVTGIQVAERYSGKAVFIGPNPGDAKAMLDKFSEWWNRDRGKIPSAVFAALAHLYFVNIHPFGDGNGRTARILAEKVVPKEDSIFRTYSLSAEILHRQRDYYTALDKVRSPESSKIFVNYILDRQHDAIQTSITLIDRKREQKRFWEKYKEEHFSPNQKYMLDSMILSLTDEIWDGSRIARGNIPEAFSELRDLEKRGFLKKGKFRRDLIPPENSKSNTQAPAFAKTNNIKRTMANADPSDEKTSKVNAKATESEQNESQGWSR